MLYEAGPDFETTGLKRKRPHQDGEPAEVTGECAELRDLGAEETRPIEKPKKFGLRKMFKGCPGPLRSDAEDEPIRMPRFFSLAARVRFFVEKWVNGFRHHVRIVLANEFRLFTGRVVRR